MLNLCKEYKQIIYITIYNHVIILSEFFLRIYDCLYYTVKPVNKGHPMERQNVVFINKSSLFGGYIVLLHQGNVIKM